MKKRAENYWKRKKPKERIKIELDLLDGLPRRRRFPEFANRTFWLKPVGVSGRILPRREDYSASRRELHFSQRRPAGVRVGHILIAYAVGWTNILSVYEVETLPQEMPPEEYRQVDPDGRWPWLVEGRSLTENYGGIWWKHNLKITDLKDSFLRENPSGYITYVGGKTLGALNHGHDKLHLTNDFALYIIDKVMAIDNEEE